MIPRRSNSIFQLWAKVEMMIICLWNYYIIKLKDKLLARNINTEVIASNFRRMKTARFNPHGQSYKVLKFLKLLLS